MEICASQVGALSCKLEKDHTGWHDAKCGVHWEDRHQRRVKRSYQEVYVGKISGDAVLRTYVHTECGHKYYYDTQIQQAKETD